MSKFTTNANRIKNNLTLTADQFIARKMRLLREINQYRHEIRMSEPGTVQEVHATLSFRSAKRAYRQFKGAYGV